MIAVIAVAVGSVPVVAEGGGEVVADPSVRAWVGVVSLVAFVVGLGLAAWWRWRPRARR